MISSFGLLMLIVAGCLVWKVFARRRWLTLLGIAAILYAVVTFSGSPPRDPASGERMSRFRSVSRPFADSKETIGSQHTGRARRPALRPERPTVDERLELPPRAGEIPVSAELAQAASADTSPPEKAEPDVDEAAGEAVPEKVPAAPPEPTPSETPSDPPSQSAGAGEGTAASIADPTPGTASESTASSEPLAENIAESIVMDDEPRPDWIDAQPKLIGGVYVLPIRSGLYSSVPECQHALDVEIKRAADQYIDDYLGEEAAGLVDIPLAYLKQHVARAEYAEVRQSEALGPLSPMHQIHARLEFDERARADFQRRWRDTMVTKRLWNTGAGAALVLALLATFYGYLRLDLRTGEAHKGGLQLAATLVALTVAAGALSAELALLGQVGVATLVALLVATGALLLQWAVPLARTGGTRAPVK